MESESWRLKARLGSAQQGAVRFDPARLGEATKGVARLGLLRQGTVWSGGARHGNFLDWKGAKN